MIDITDVPEARSGDPVLIFGGEERPLTALAEACDTIPYEILTGLSGRIQRRYWRE
jgi:putative bifunctional UDP-N-acetylmuramoyl-tripeptide:D-alanyl-D-alanine ligase/alanine racemase